MPSSSSLRKLKRFSEKKTKNLSDTESSQFEEEANIAKRAAELDTTSKNGRRRRKRHYSPESLSTAPESGGTSSEFAPRLILRSNIDLNDKWRNLSIGVGLEQVSTTKKRKNLKGLSRFAQPSCSLSKGTSRNVVIDSKTEERYNELIFEALLTMRNPDGLVGAIGDFIQQRVEDPAPQNFKRVVGARLRSLVSLGKLEKTHNGFKIKEHSFVGTNTRSELAVYTKIDDAVVCETAYLIADAENKSFLAAQAVNEAERISKIAEENEYMLLLIKEIYEQCSVRMVKKSPWQH